MFFQNILWLVRWHEITSLFNWNSSEKVPIIGIVCSNRILLVISPSYWKYFSVMQFVIWYLSRYQNHVSVILVKSNKCRLKIWQIRFICCRWHQVAHGAHILWWTVWTVLHPQPQRERSRSQMENAESWATLWWRTPALLALKLCLFTEKSGCGFKGRRRAPRMNLFNVFRNDIIRCKIVNALKRRFFLIY